MPFVDGCFERAHELHAEAIKDREYFINKILDHKDEKVRGMVNSICESVEVKQWMRGDEKNLLICGDTGHVELKRTGKPSLKDITESSYALAVIAKFLADKKERLVLSYSVARHLADSEAGKLDLQDILISLNFQLIYQVLGPKAKLSYQELRFLTARYLSLRRSGMENLVTFFQELRKRLPETENIYVIVDLNDYEDSEDVFESLMRLKNPTEQVGAGVKFLIADPRIPPSVDSSVYSDDSYNYYEDQGIFPHETLLLGNPSSGIIKINKIFNAWDQAME